MNLYFLYFLFIFIVTFVRVIFSNDLPLHLCRNSYFPLLVFLPFFYLLISVNSVPFNISTDALKMR